MKRMIVSALLLSSMVLVPLRAEAAAPPPVAHEVARPRASLGVHIDGAQPWIGQPIPVTVTAIFRDVEGVTLEGQPTFSSKAIVTSELAKDPRQSTEIVGGERVLVARWTGKVTPSAAGPLDLSVDLPVRLRWREAAPRRVERPVRDPFGDLDEDDPFASVFRGMRQQMQDTLEGATGRVREEARQLRASAPSVDVRALPTAGRPADYSGAVGAFAITDALTTDHGAVSDPLTLRITVSGAVDPDRVDVPGVAPSADWKAYPPRAVPADADAGVTARAATKTFEQVLVPLHGGTLTVPPVAFTSFDPATGAYMTHATRPLDVDVAGAAAPVPSAIAPALAPIASPAASAAPTITLPAVTPVRVALLLVPLALLAIALLARGYVARKRAAWTLRRTMRTAAAAGAVEPFLGSAHRLIEERLSARWNVAPGDVTPRQIEDRLGEAGRPLADVLVADAALRFGRREVDGLELRTLCRSVERSLRDAA